MSGLYDYMTEQEYYIHVIESVVDNKMKHLNMEFDKLMIEHAVNLSDIETKVLMESGNSKHLEDLYMFEAEEMKQKSEGIITKLINTVRGFFRKIKEVLFGKKEEPADVNAQVTTNANPDDVIKEGNSLIASLRDFKNKHKRGIKMAATGAVIGAGITIGWKMLKPKLNKMQSQSDEIDGYLEEIQRLMIEDKSMSSQEQINAKILTNRAQNYGKHVLGFSKLSPAEQSRRIQADTDRTANKLAKIDSKAAPYSRQIDELERQIQDIDRNINKQQSKYDKEQKGSFHPFANRRNKKLEKIENTSKFLRTNQDKADYAKLVKKDPARYIEYLKAELADKEKQQRKLRQNYNNIISKKTKLLK